MSDQQTVFRTRFATTWIGIVSVALLVAWDLYARQFDGGTISEVTLTWVRAHPAFTAALFYTMGHLTWPQVADGICAHCKGGLK